MSISKAEIEAAKRVIEDEVGLPYMARVRDFDPPDGAWDDAARARLKEADAQAERANDAFVERVLAAAAAARQNAEQAQWADEKEDEDG